jgi:hypothetical protein
VYARARAFPQPALDRAALDAPADARYQRWYVSEGRATDRAKPPRTRAAVVSASVDAVVEVDVPPTVRFRLRVFSILGDDRPLVLIEETADNPGPPAPHVLPEIAQAVRSRYLPPGGPEPIWVEAWLGRALTALVRGTLPFCTYMRVRPETTPPRREAISAVELEKWTGASLRAGSPRRG